MADDIQDDKGNWLAADDLGGGRKIPRVKLAAGADGEAADISEANPLFVQIAGASGGGSETDLSIVLYRVKTAFTGASVGDTVSATRAITVVDDTVTQVGSTLWRNESTDAVLVSAPSAANLEAVGATGLTNAQLVAAGLATQTTAAAILAGVTAATPAGENLIGATGTPGDVITITPALDTTAYAVGDVLFDRTVVTNAVRTNGGWGILQSLALTDKADIGPALDLYVLSTNVTLGTFNVAPSISDANALKLTYIGSIAAADWKDVGGAKVVSLRGIGQQLKAETGVRDLYLAAITQTAATWANGDIEVDVGMLWS